MSNIQVIDESQDSYLESAVKILREYQQDMAVRIFEFGKKLVEVRDYCKKAGFGQWEEYIREKLGMTRQYVHNFIKIYEKFGDPDDSMREFVAGMGISKLSALTKLNSEVDITLLADVKISIDGEIKNITDLSAKQTAILVEQISKNPQMKELILNSAEMEKDQEKKGIDSDRKKIESLIHRLTEKEDKIASLNDQLAQAQDVARQYQDEMKNKLMTADEVQELKISYDDTKKEVEKLQNILKKEFEAKKKLHDSMIEKLRRVLASATDAIHTAAAQISQAIEAVSVNSGFSEEIRGWTLKSIDRMRVYIDDLRHLVNEKEN